MSRMLKVKAAKRVPFLGYSIEREGSRWYIIDWDYETERTIAGPFGTLDKACHWVMANG